MSPKDIPLGHILPSPRRHSYVRHNRFFPKEEEGTNSFRPQITQTFSPFLPPQNIRYVKTFRFSQRKMKEKSIGQTSLSFLFGVPLCVCRRRRRAKGPAEKGEVFFLLSSFSPMAQPRRRGRMDSPFSFVLSGFFILDISSLSIQKRLDSKDSPSRNRCLFSSLERRAEKKIFAVRSSLHREKKSSFPPFPLFPFPFCSIFFRWLEKEEEGEG